MNSYDIVMAVHLYLFFVQAEGCGAHFVRNLAGGKKSLSNFVTYPVYVGIHSE